MTDGAITVFAPGRVNLIGDHTDYAGGLSLPCAIDLGVTITGHAANGHIELQSGTLDGTVAFDTASPPTMPSIDPPWGRHVAAVLAQPGIVGGFVGHISSTLPVGAGLSSSAALDVALALALGHDGPRMDLARLAQRAETAAVGVPCGLLDQLSVVFGRADHVMMIDFGDDSIDQVRFPDDLDIWIVHSGQERVLESSAYAERRAACELAASRIGPLPVATAAAIDSLDGSLRRRARHVATECARVRDAVVALRHGDPVRLGRLMTESHASLREDFEVSTPTLDRVVALMLETPGVHGARLTGAGFGGCAVAVCAHGAVTDPTALTGRGWLVRPAEGARRIDG